MFARTAQSSLLISSESCSMQGTPFYPNVIPAPCPAALPRSYHRKIISHSDGQSVVNGKTKKPLQRHQKSAGALLSLQNDVLCNGFEIQNHTVFMSLRR